MPFVTSVSIPEARHERIRPFLKANNPKGMAFNAIVNEALDSWLVKHEPITKDDIVAAIDRMRGDGPITASPDFFPSGQLTKP